MEISPDGRFLAVSVDDGVRLYDVSTFVPEPGTLALLVTGLTTGLLTYACDGSKWHRASS